MIYGFCFLKEVHLKINSKETKKLFTRRSFSYFLSLFFVNAAFVNFDFAYAKSSRVKKAEQLAIKIFNNIFKIINQSTSQQNKKKSLLILFDNYADVPIIARAVLGSPWRQLNQSERNNFTNAFRQYLAKKYTAQFSEFLGAEMLIEKSMDSGGKAGIMVETRLLMPGSAPIKVGWQVSDASGMFKMIDVKIEGISLLTTERGEIRNQYSKEGKSITKLINSLLNY